MSSQDSDVAEVYGELRKIAAIHLSRGRQASLQATQLVHEAWLRLSGRGWKSRTHFLALASHTMRLVLIDAVRFRMARKRGGGEKTVAWKPGTQFAGASMALPIEQVLEVHHALDELAAKDSRKARVVEMRFFGGLEFHEIAEVLNISMATAKRDWEFSRSWLYTKLHTKAQPSGSH